MKKLLFAIISILFSITMPITAIYVQNRIFPLAENYAISSAKKQLYSLTYQSVADVTHKNEYTFNTLSKFTYNKEGKITTIDSNTNKANMMRNEIEKSINKKINNKQTQKIHIPLGSITNFFLLNGLGPKIPIRVNYSDVSNVDITDSFSSAGINQTRVQSNIVITSEISIIMPTKTTTSKIKTTVPLSDTIIVGEVPNLYTNYKNKQ